MINIDAETVRRVDEWLDDAVDDSYRGDSYGQVSLAQDWARVAKAAEEAGEAISALIACTGQNPRKGVCGTEDDLLNELADVALTGILAIQHFTKSTDKTARVLAAKVEALGRRVPAPEAVNG